jgi:hypothetical protein
VKTKNKILKKIINFKYFYNSEVMGTFAGFIA